MRKLEFAFLLLFISTACTSTKSPQNIEPLQPISTMRAKCSIHSLKETYLKAEANFILSVNGRAEVFSASDGLSGVVSLHGPTEKLPFVTLGLGVLTSSNEKSSPALSMVRVDLAGETLSILTASLGNPPGSGGMVHLECRTLPN